MKLRGILDSKGRREVWERNNAPQSPQPEPKPERQHDAQPQPDGTVLCCGARYARHAHAAHIRGEKIGAWASGIGMVREDQDEAFAEWERSRGRPVYATETEAQAAAWRAEMVAAYYANERRGRRGIVADGADPSCYGW